MLSYTIEMIKKIRKIFLKLPGLKKLKKRRLFFYFLGLSVWSLLFFSLIYWERAFPGVYLAQTPVSGKTREDIAKIVSKIEAPGAIVISSKENSYPINLSEIEFRFAKDKTVESVLAFGRNSGLLGDFSSRFKALREGVNIPLAYTLDEGKLERKLAEIASFEDIPAVEATLEIEDQGIKVTPGKTGVSVHKEMLKASLSLSFSAADFEKINLPRVVTTPALTDEEIQRLASRAQGLIGKNLVVSFEDRQFNFSDQELVDLLFPPDLYKTNKIAEIAETLAKEINRQPQNAKFVFEQGKVQEFKPAKDGISLEELKFIENFVLALEKLEDKEEKTQSVTVSAVVTPPKITTASVNDFGIKELIGVGKSNFRGSIASRVHNIALAAGRFNGVLIAPGEIFSFNQVLGDVSAFTGYQQAYIIKDGKTVLGDGGGVCQVSSTFFRAALDAGLGIVERRAHSYRVSYYEQGFPPGLDATVYAPSPDLKIKNDTPAHILIQTRTDTKGLSLVFEFYGTSDGRVVSLGKPKISNVVAPPPDLYQDDPTLPLGKIKQIDYKAWGARVTFDYKVTRGGEVLEERTFISNYRPWQAVFLRGTGQ